MSARDEEDPEVQRAQNRAGKGTYYALAGEVWHTQVESFRGGYDAIFRRTPRGHFRRLLESCGFVEDRQHRSSSGTSSQPSNKIPGVKKKDLYGHLGGEDAHGVPKLPNCAPPYGIIGQPIVGFDVEELSLDALKRAQARIDGVAGTDEKQAAKQSSTNSQKQKKKQQQREEDRQKKQAVVKILKYLVEDAGVISIKNSPYNLTRVSGNHQDAYDVDPKLIIVPLMTLEAAKEWTPGVPYDVAIVSSTVDTYIQHVAMKPLENKYNRTVGLASPSEMANGTALLAAMVKAHAEIAAGDRAGGVVNPVDLMTPQDQENMKELYKDLRNGRVEVPVANNSGKVLKVRLEEKHDYMVPDPLILAMKAAINWYYITKQKKLLPACVPVDPETALLEELQLEQHEEDMQEALRPKSIVDLAKGLHQWHPSTPESQGSQPARVSLSPKQDKDE